MDTIKLKQISSLEKVFLTDSAEDKQEYSYITALKGERISYQIMYTSLTDQKIDVFVNISSPIKEMVSLRLVGNVPSELPVYPQKCDDNYITKKPGLFPDVLYPLKDNRIEIIPHSYHALWITSDISISTEAGRYPIEIFFVNTDLDINETKTFYIDVKNAILPEEELIYTQWFHADCIASYYNLEVFSEKHWDMIEKFIEIAAHTGINMLLTPIFTPPLDTAVGGERPTVQLVDISLKNGSYSFNFDKLKRWIQICQKHKIKYFEMAHLFTQWGAEFTPKIVVDNKKIFGWHVKADSAEYKEFLDHFLPALTEFLRNIGIAEYTYFHISDEPHGEKHLEQYIKAKKLVSKHLVGFKIIDALSDFEFYKSGAVENPIPANDAIEPFLEAEIENLWTYYCCMQGKNVSNRFMSMPSYRNRIIALQLYKFDIKGFLHWGFNFYYSQHSKHEINPFLTTDAINAFPSGDAFSVYPYIDGPIESIRSVVFYEALQDLRALKLLENITGQEKTLELLEEDISPITFSEYPHDARWLINKREEINHRIENGICKKG